MHFPFFALWEDEKSQESGDFPYSDGQIYHSFRGMEQGWFPEPDKSQVTMGCHIQRCFCFSHFHGNWKLISYFVCSWAKGEVDR